MKRKLSIWGRKTVSLYPFSQLNHYEFWTSLILMLFLNLWKEIDKANRRPDHVLGYTIANNQPRRSHVGCMAISNTNMFLPKVEHLS